DGGDQAPPRLPARAGRRLGAGARPRPAGGRRARRRRAPGVGGGRVTERLSARVCDDVGQVPAAGWDEVVEAAGAPVFYRHRYLRAYAASGLSGAEATAGV